jgi:hypothetical protein
MCLVVLINRWTYDVGARTLEISLVGSLEKEKVLYWQLFSF